MKLTGSNNIYHIPYRKYLNLVEECIKFLKTTIELVHESKNLTQLKCINIYIYILEQIFTLFILFYEILHVHIHASWEALIVKLGKLVINFQGNMEQGMSFNM